MARNGNSEHSTKALPVEIKKLRGSRTDRDVSDPVKFTPIRDNPPPPSYMGMWGILEWHRILDEFKISKIFSMLDIPVITMHCKAWDDYNRIQQGLMDGTYSEFTESENGYKQVSPWMTLLQRSIDTMKFTEQRLGLSPVSRTKISSSINKKDEKDEFGEMFDKKKAQ